MIRVTLGPLYRFGPLVPRHCRGLPMYATAQRILYAARPSTVTRDIARE